MMAKNFKELRHIYLPGYSPTNADSVQQFEDFFTKKKLDFQAIRYAHWQDEAGAMKADFEIGRFLALIGRDGQSGKGYGVMAKSVGTRLLLQTIDTKDVKPQYIVLMGVPNGVLDAENGQYVKRVLSKVQLPVLWIVNQKDHISSLDLVKRASDGIKGLELKIKDTSGHQYLYMEQIYEWMISDPKL